MNKIICIAGPTASGKTALAVALAKAINGEVISCDSMQIYKGMTIGTAMPTSEEMQGIPHYMLDIAEPWEEFSVSRYCEMADPIISDILARGKTAIIAGGTGMREKLEAQADAEGMEAMLNLLATIDPDSAARLHLKDRKRILRALEVYYETGETITAHNLKTQQIPPKYSAVWFGLEDENRQDLYDRIDARVEKMLEAGLLDEIKALLASGIPEKCTAMQAIGYKEFVAHLNGQATLEDSVSLVQQASRHYAKRQLTWFRRNQNICWLRRKSGENTEQILRYARQYLAEFDK